MKNEKSQFARQIWKKKYANLCRRMQDYKKKNANLWEETGQIH